MNHDKDTLANKLYLKKKYCARSRLGLGLGLCLGLGLEAGLLRHSGGHLIWKVGIRISVMVRISVTVSPPILRILQRKNLGLKNREVG